MVEQIRITIDDSKLVAMIRATVRARPVRIVADGVEYGIYQELGTKRMGAHPFMRPAVEAVRQGFLKAWQSVDNLTQAETVVEKTARDVESGAKTRAPVDTGALRSSIHVIEGEQFVVEFAPERELTERERGRFG